MASPCPAAPTPPAPASCLELGDEATCLASTPRPPCPPYAGEQVERDVRLGHVRREPAERRRRPQRRGVEQQPPVRRRRARGEDVEQRGLAGAARPHDGQDLPGASREGHVSEDVVRRRRRRAARLQKLRDERPRRGGRLRIVDVPGGELVRDLLGRWRRRRWRQCLGIVRFRDSSSSGCHCGGSEGAEGVPEEERGNVLQIRRP